MYIKFNVEKLKELSVKRLQNNEDYLRFVDLMNHKEIKQAELERKKSELETKINDLKNEDLISKYSAQIAEIDKMIAILNKKTIVGDTEEFSYGNKFDAYLSWEVDFNQANERYIMMGIVDLLCDKNYWPELKKNAEEIGIPQLKEEQYLKTIANIIENEKICFMFSEYEQLQKDMGLNIYIKALEKVFFIATLPSNMYKYLNEAYCIVDESHGGDFLDRMEIAYRRNYDGFAIKVLESFINDKFYEEKDIEYYYIAMCLIYNPKIFLESKENQIIVRPAKKVFGSISKELAKKGIYTGVDWFTYISNDGGKTRRAIERIDLNYQITDEEIEKLLDDDEAYKLAIEEIQQVDIKK